MASNLRKCVALGPQGTQSPGSAHQDYRNNRSWLIETNTKYVKLWVSWDLFQPVGGYAPGVDPEGTTPAPSYLFSELDAQIRQANADNINVILGLWTYPYWANLNNQRTYASQQGSKPGRYCFPDDLSPTSPWAKFVNYLISRYNPGNGFSGAYINFLEICNEPNSQNWPQLSPLRGSTGVPVAHCYAGQMMHSASVVNQSWGSKIILAGPGVLDVTTDGVGTTNYVTFITQTIAWARSLGFTDDHHFVWTHHNYGDIQYNIARPNLRATKAYQQLIDSGWLGWGDQISSPMMFLTEGGFIRDHSGVPAGSADSWQNFNLKTGWDNLFNNASDGGKGIGMFTNYLFVTDPNWETGLRATDGSARLAYTDAWAQHIPGGWYY